MVPLWSVNRWSNRGYAPTAYKENTAGLHDIEIRTCLVHSTEDCADTERPDRGVQGIHLDILSKAFGYVLRSRMSTTWLESDRAIPDTLTCGGEW